MADKKVKKEPKESSARGVFASDVVASTYGKHMDERSTVLESVLAKKMTAEAHIRVAGAAEEDFRAAVLASVRFFAQVADEIFPKVSADSRATVIGALISAYGARGAEIHLNLVRATSLVEEAQAHVESLPEFGKHAV